jgi:hypothetical protein
MTNYKFMDKALYLEQEKILVIADLHIGFEEHLLKGGVFLPRFQYKKITGDLEKIFRKTGKVEEVVILGDLKHEFGSISRQEWKETLALLDFLRKKTSKIILIKGNHDTILEPIARERGVMIKDFYVKGELAFMHGHRLFSKVLDEKVKKIFLGHLHPAISIRQGVKQEIYKCFLVGGWKGRKIVILPSFFPLTEGQDVFIEDTNLDKKFNFNLKKFEVYVPVEGEDKVLDFGKTKEIGRLV